ncbi:MAG: radical SAM protein [Deltaproteobacteria bacterium]|nr:radical SAM protein [Deltaproteobacteria bacterium]
MLVNEGFEVVWDDAIAENLSPEDWLRRVRDEHPDLMVIESKTPVVKRHWKIIDTVKKAVPDILGVMVGDHVTALPQESMKNSQTDFVLTGGDYDFLLLNLCRNLRNYRTNNGISAEVEKQLEPGIWYRKNGRICNTGRFVLNHDLCSLPMIDRNLSKWQLYAYKNGNFKYTPGAYVMAGRDCWWGRCTFCSWTTLYPAGSFRTVPVKRHLDEVGSLIEKYGIREIFDDSGCFPKRKWLEEFCRGMISRGYNKRVTLGCNTRIGAQTKTEFQLMKKANFRFVLIGLESVSQNTLRRLRKGIRVEDIENACRTAKNAGLEPHLTIMVGYPWETLKDAETTIEFARRMFRKGIIDSLQATIVTPYPGTALFSRAVAEGWLTTQDWDDYDMKHVVWKSAMTESKVMELTRTIYRSAITPRFVLHKLCSVRSLDDVKFYWKAGKKLAGHLADFNAQRTSQNT